MYIRISLLLLLSLINLAFCCTGCIDLDELTFEKTIKKFKTALIKFDVSFPYGTSHEEFTKFSQQINNKTINGFNHPDLLIGTIGVKDYGEMENKNIADKYEVKAEQFPVIKLFNDGDLANPVSFDRGTEDLTTTNLFLFLKHHSKTYVQAPGCNKKLDQMTEKFMSDKHSRKKILKEAETLIEKFENNNKLAMFYAVMMKGILEYGDEFIQKQNERMAKLLKDKLSGKKIEELKLKLNILSSFKFNGSAKDEL